MGAQPATLALLLSTMLVPPSDVPFDLSYDDFAMSTAGAAVPEADSPRLDAETIAAWPFDPPPESASEGGLNLARINYPAGSRFPVPYAAGADLESAEPERQLELAAPTTVCKLWESDFADEEDMWMSDDLSERLSMFHNARACHGDVLVGGLGLGLFAQMLAQNPAVSSMTVVDLSPQVAALAWPGVERTWRDARPGDTPPAVRLITADLEAVMASYSQSYPQYDCVFLDTWATLSSANLPYVNHLRDLALAHCVRPRGRVLLWGYAFMLHLLAREMHVAAGMTPTEVADARAAHPLPRMLDDLLGAQLDTADGAAPPMVESRRRAVAHGSTLVRPKPYDAWV